MTSTSQLELAELAEWCAQETRHFFKREHYDPRYCMELFRRAIQDRNERAWEFVYEQYSPLVLGWIRQHKSYPDCQSEERFLANWAFDRMWSAISPEKFSRHSALAGLLRYLRMCVNSVIVDHLRASEALIEIPNHAADPAPLPEKQVLNDMMRKELWRLVDQELKDDRERLVFQESFSLGLKPAAICDKHPDVFGSVSEVYRVKENVIARLRRNDELQIFLGLAA